LKATAAQLNLAGVMNIRVPETRLGPDDISPQCLVLARNPERLQPLIARGWLPLGPDDGLPAAAPWTDDYINILAPLWANLRPHPLASSAARAEPAK
jgi:hypothetical protein